MLVISEKTLRLHATARPRFAGLAGAITIVKQKTGRKLKSQMYLEQHA